MFSDGQQEVPKEVIPHDPIGKLREVLTSGLTNDIETRGANIARSLDQMDRDNQHDFQQAKEGTPKAKDADILDNLITSKKVTTKLDLGRILSGYGYRHDDDPNNRLAETIFPTTQLVSILKALKAIPQDAPDGGEFTQSPDTNQQFIEIITKNGKVTSAERTILDTKGKRHQIIEYTCPTVIEGVSAIVDFSQENPFIYLRSNGHPLAETVGLKLEPKFIAESLDLKLPETPVPEEPNK